MSQDLYDRIVEPDWEARATTAEEKVKERSVRACEAENRIRELEEAQREWSQSYAQLQAAYVEKLNDIGKLEAELKEADEHIPYLERCEQESIQRGARLEELTRRIRKAREILERCVAHGEQLGPMNMQRALDALEGR